MEMHHAMTAEFKNVLKRRKQCMQGGASGGEIRHHHFFHFLSRVDSFFHGYIPSLISWTPR